MTKHVRCGTFFAGNKVRLTLGIPLSAVLLHTWGWPAVFYITGGLGFLWLLWWLATSRAPAREPEPSSDSAAEPMRWRCARARPSLPSWRWPFGTRLSRIRRAVDVCLEALRTAQPGVATHASDSPASLR